MILDPHLASPVPHTVERLLTMPVVQDGDALEDIPHGTDGMRRRAHGPARLALDELVRLPVDEEAKALAPISGVHQCISTRSSCAARGPPGLSNAMNNL